MSDAALAVVMPIGPAGVDPAQIADTAASIRAWWNAPHLVIVDDAALSDAAYADLAPGTQIVRCRTWPSGRDGRLAARVIAGVAGALENPRWRWLVRMDLDALATGPGIVAAADAFARERPNVGALGAFRCNATGASRDPAPVARQLGADIARDTAVARWLADRIARAEAREVRRGEHVLGGGCLLSRPAAVTLVRETCDRLVELTSLTTPEDGIVSVVLAAAGVELADWSSPGDPLGCTWRGLYAPPPVVERDGKLLIHSVRSAPEGWDEPAIRAWFAARRPSA